MESRSTFSLFESGVESGRLTPHPRPLPQGEREKVLRSIRGAGLLQSVDAAAGIALAVSRTFMTRMQTPPPPAEKFKRSGIRQFFADYFWFIFKNVIGWLLIFASPVLGAMVPGPGGIPVFLIGFAMVTFPGKRKLTTRVLRGKPMRVQTMLFTGLTAAISLIVPGLALWYAVARWGDVFRSWKLGGVVIVGVVVLAFFSTWLATRLGLWVVNLILLNLPRLRRKIRPWLRRQGINLLPPRRREPTGAPATGAAEDEILEIHERHHQRLRSFVSGFRQWAYRAISLAITIAIFVWILRPVARHWQLLDDAILSISPLRFLAAAAMLSSYLLVFRALTWRHVLGKLGRSLPVPAATRIWALTELARLLPGGIWQTAPRISLIRAYGVEPVQSMTSHVIEFTVVFLANLLIGTAAILWFFALKFQKIDGLCYVGLALLPLSALILRQRTFQTWLNRALRTLNKPPVAVLVPTRFLVALLAWDLLGIVWQAMAIWLLLGQSELMGLNFSHLYFVAGAYSLAWCAGKFAVWAPAGIGVRELAFVYLVFSMASPASFRVPLSEHITWIAHLALAAILLRLWSVAGEIILASTAYITDRKHAPPPVPAGHR